MDRSLPDYSSVRPAGGKRSGKRDRILGIFLRQEGHLSADDLFDVGRREEPGIGRATVYRTLQWMVDADIARKVDFGDGRSRYEEMPSAHHDHLIDLQSGRVVEFRNEQIEKLQTRKLKNLVAWADARVPWHAARLKSAGVTADSVAIRVWAMR